MKGNFIPKAMTMILPDASVLQWVKESLDSYTVVSHYAHDHAYSQLWRLAVRGEFYWLKCHQYPGKWAGEVHALTHWTPRLNLAAPKVRGYRTEPLAVLLTEIPGTMATNALLDSEAEQTLWYEAGSYLARLHTIENEWLGAPNLDGTAQGETHHDPERFVRGSLESRLAQGTEQGLFDSAEQAFIAFGAREWPTALAEETPRAIHRDYSPRNWMTDASGHLTGVIDFEHARWDVRAADLNRWWDTTFVEKPRLAYAFFDGYLGRPPGEELRAQIQALRLLNAVSGVVWATRVGDVAFAHSNRVALQRMMAECS